MAGNNQAGPVGAALPIPPAVRVASSEGTPGVGWRVSFSGDAQSSVAIDTAVTDASGVASAGAWTLGAAAGVQRLHATASQPELASLSIAFSATGFAGPPAAVRILAGDSALALPGTVLDSIEARVVDTFGNGIAGVPVQWTVIEGGGSVAPGSSQSEGAGRARARWTLGAEAGRNRLAVAIADTEAVFVATAAATRPLAATLVAAGGGHTCAILTPADGGVTHCWGQNEQGALGRGSPDRPGTVRSIAAPVRGEHAFASIVTGGSHSCGLTTAGVAYCWGANWAGQLGDGTATDQPQPVQVRYALGFTGLVAGQWHTCGLTASGITFCWGDNTFGALGDGTTTSRALPAIVAAPARFTALAAGDGFTCGVSEDRGVFCWGRNGRGQLGGPSSDTCGIGYYWYDYPEPCGLLPQRVVGPPPLVAVAAGYGSVCGSTADGEPHCWGAQVSTRGPIDLRLTHLVIGYENACGLDAEGGVHCWILRLGGQYRARVGAGIRFASLSGFASHFCGVSSGGPSIAYCWGQNSYGQLGDGTTQPRAEPVAAVSLVAPERRT